MIYDGTLVPSSMTPLLRNGSPGLIPTLHCTQPEQPMVSRPIPTRRGAFRKLPDQVPLPCGHSFGSESRMALLGQPETLVPDSFASELVFPDPEEHTNCDCDRFAFQCPTTCEYDYDESPESQWPPRPKSAPRSFPETGITGTFINGSGSSRRSDTSKTHRNAKFFVGSGPSPRSATRSNQISRGPSDAYAKSRISFNGATSTSGSAQSMRQLHSAQATMRFRSQQALRDTRADRLAFDTPPTTSLGDPEVTETASRSPSTRPCLTL